MEILAKETEQLKERLKAVALPPELKDRIGAMIYRLDRVSQFGGYSAEYESVARYVDWVVSLPWAAEAEESFDLPSARRVLDKNHYGMEKVKQRIFEYLAVRKLTRNSADRSGEKAEVLCFVGLPGIGKTSAASSIAQALGRPFVRIAMGGMGSVEQLRGQSRSFSDAEPGLIIKNLRRVGVRNPVILLDEIDRVTDQGWSGVMGALLELLDPEQNLAFFDHYIDYPFDLSRVLFLCSANNTRNISTAVVDRLEVVEMPSYTDDEKYHIGKDYLLPRSLSEAGLKPSQVVIDDTLWPKIIRPLGYDAGIRTLDRTIEGICRKVALKVVEGKGETFTLTADNIKDFLPSW